MSNKNVKKKLAYVDFHTHVNTKSGDFLREILSEEFEAKNGEFKYSQKPGLGVEVDENKLNEFIIEPSL